VKKPSSDAKKTGGVVKRTTGWQTVSKTVTMIVSMPNEYMGTPTEKDCAKNRAKRKNHTRGEKREQVTLVGGDRNGRRGTRGNPRRNTLGRGGNHVAPGHVVYSGLLVKGVSPQLLRWQKKKKYAWGGEMDRVISVPCADWLVYREKKRGEKEKGKRKKQGQQDKE